MRRTQQSARELFQRYGPMVYRRALTLLGNHHDAEEALQEVFVRALKTPEGFEQREQVSSWLYRITTNWCLNGIRNAKRRQELWEEHGTRSADTADQARKMVLVRQVLAQVDERCAEAAIACYVDGMSHHEAADLLGVSRRTVGNLLVRFNETAGALLNVPPGDKETS